jgi:DNA-binding transcriptional ArsR family regulator
MLRKSIALDALISRTKQQVLAATLLQPERSWYLLELARHLRVTPSSIQRELGLLVKSGILKRWEDGNRVYFQADRNCPIFPDLRRILAKTAGLVDVLKEGLAPLRGKIDVAFVYGSIASSEEHAWAKI